MVKQIGAATSGKRGINVSMIARVSAASTFVPPAIIFPHVYYKEHMINNAQPGTNGIATSSGQAFPLAFTAGNITAGFRVTAISPFNEEVFEYHEILPAEMTNRTYNVEPAEPQSPEALPLWQNICDESRSETPPTSVALRQTVSEKKASKVTVTDTPEKQRIKEEKIEKTKSCLMKRNAERAVEFLSSSSEDAPSKDNRPLIFSESSWVLVRYEVTDRTKRHVYCAGKVLEITEKDDSVKFLRKQRIQFAFPNVDDCLATVIILDLPVADLIPLRYVDPYLLNQMQRKRVDRQKKFEEIVAKKKKAWKSCLNSKLPEAYEKYKNVKKVVKDKVIEAKNKQWEKFGHKMEKHAKGNKKRNTVQNN
ncbi:hypothetical protein ILUMI_23254 [Ignelater luminosus]|uniref:Uncharacterized protein n=1 Tax=Ignelater luminosus TaxID=2038154 RepID=A0A8K0CB93_IGNLU|nr:hypothetical protein ILUMI_23254 [Ignelater luminosus]